jgi:SAM-dependent methyltransferase
MNRVEKLLLSLNPDGIGLEVGPGCYPLVAGNPAFNARALDHADQAGMIAKYSAQGENVSGIPFIDYVWDGRSYKELVGDQKFDYIIASHVLEHIPDTIGFINDCSSILAEGGVLSLALPDRRFTFDYYRPRASIGKIIDAHLARKSRPSPGDMAEQVAYMAAVDGNLSWSSGHCEGFPTMLHGPISILHEYNKVVKGEFIDQHVWVFTPSSFRWVMGDLYDLGFIDLRESAFFETELHEFIIQLRRQGDGPDVTRQELAQRAMVEGGPND